MEGRKMLKADKTMSFQILKAMKNCSLEQSTVRHQYCLRILTDSSLAIYLGVWLET